MVVQGLQSDVMSTHDYEQKIQGGADTLCLPSPHSAAVSVMQME